jgi:hypothetical protein
VITKTASAVAACLALLCAGACSGGGAKQSTATTTPAPTESTLPTTPVTTGLRGIGLPDLSCTAKPASPNGGVQAINGVQEFVVCRSGLGGAPRPPLTVRPTDPQFARLSAALSAPNAPRTNQACPALAELEIVLLARTPTGAFQVSIPVDGCDLYQRAAVEAINGTPVSPAS